MRKAIPVYDINNLSGQSASSPHIFFSDHQIINPGSSINIPYRSNYFGIGICVAGKAMLKANLDLYHVEKHCIIAMSPPVIKQWVHMSADYKTMAVFFTRDFFLKGALHNDQLDNFPFFDPNANHVSKYGTQGAKIVKKLLDDIRVKLSGTHTYKYEIVRNLLGVLLFEMAALYDRQNFRSFHAQTRSEQLAIEFKKLVCLHYAKERSVQYYADLLFVTPKHLTEVVKQHTGKPAKEWIDELVILEAKVLLRNTSLTVASIADALSFTDQATFGKFFKNNAGASPLAYRQSP